MKAIALISGGLDSILAAKLIIDQGIEVVGVYHVLPFVSEKKDWAGQVGDCLRIPLRRLEAGEDYLELVRHPRFGYGSGMNPCLDCRIYMLRGAGKVAEETGASFVITGDVLGQRPMTQTRKKLALEEKEAELDGLILRPLTAKELPETTPEREGWVDREKLLGIRGRSRKPQMTLARDLNLSGYRSPDSGCLLVNKEFAQRIRDLFGHQDHFSMRDAELLRIGRHFYHGPTKVIVGRNEQENLRLLELREADECVLEAVGVGSPVTLVQGPARGDVIDFAARLTAMYSDADAGEAIVEVRGDGVVETMTVDPERE
jgi:hypothetical protein